MRHRRRQFRRLRRTSLVGAVLLFLLSFGYQPSPAKAVWSIRELSNPAKLATLGKRGANPTASANGSSSSRAASKPPA